MNHQYQPSTLGFPGRFSLKSCPGLALLDDIISQGMDLYHHLSAFRDPQLLPTLCPYTIGILHLLLLFCVECPLPLSPPMKILLCQDPLSAQPHLASYTCDYIVSFGCWICCPKFMGFLQAEVDIVLCVSDSIWRSEFQTGSIQGVSYSNPVNFPLSSNGKIQSLSCFNLS